MSLLGAVKKILKRLIQSVAVHGQPNVHVHQRSSLEGLLKQARSIGLRPATVIDVGAAYGLFALECHRVFPEAGYLLVEPLAEYEQALKGVVTQLLNAECVSVAAGSHSGSKVLNVHRDLVGSSLYLEQEDSDVNGTPRTVQSLPLDVIIGNRYKGPFLLKIDVQGAELDVLMGAEILLRETEYVLLEVSFFEFFKNGPQIIDVMTFMKARGFAAYDISGTQYRPLDNALSQVDMAFVREEGLFRRHHYYAKRDQRAEQNVKLAVVRDSHLRVE